MRHGLIAQLDAARSIRRRRREHTENLQRREEQGRSRSMPTVRIMMELGEEHKEIELRAGNVHLPPQKQEPEVELEILRAQIQAETARKKSYCATTSLQHPYEQPTAQPTSDIPSRSRLSAQQELVLSGSATLPDDAAATWIDQETVVRRFSTAPRRTRPVQPVLELHVDEEEGEDEGRVDYNETEKDEEDDDDEYQEFRLLRSKQNNGATSTAQSTDRFLCGVQQCSPTFQQASDESPALESTDSFSSFFAPLNDRARQLFGTRIEAKGVDETCSDAASAVTELFDNRSLQRNTTWATAFSLQEYLGFVDKAWKTPREETSTPTTVATTATPHVPGQTISPLPSREWDTEQIADRMEESLQLTPTFVLNQDRLPQNLQPRPTKKPLPANPTNDPKKGPTSAKIDPCFFVGATGDVSGIRVPFGTVQAPDQARVSNSPVVTRMTTTTTTKKTVKVPPSTRNALRTKYAATEYPNPLVKTKQYLGRKPFSGGNDFWDDLLAEGIIEDTDLSVSSNAGSHLDAEVKPGLTGDI